MNNKELKTSAEKALATYNNADANVRELLEHLFGKEPFAPKDIRERVKTFEDAIKVIGDKNPFVAQFKAMEASFKEAGNNLHLFAYARLVIIAEALNEGWRPKFDGDECRYYPWFYIYTKDEYENLDEDEKKCCRVVGRSGGSASAYGGVAYAFAYYASSFSVAGSGSRLAFRTRELAEYCGTQFIDIWEKYLFA